MKFGPKTVLILAVVAITAIGAWVRAAYAKPWMDRKTAEYAVRHLERIGALKMGDIVFQTSRSPQNRAIQEATHSPWNHCGILVRQQGSWFILEVAQQVKYTSLLEWIEQGKNAQFLVMRVHPGSNPPSPAALQALVNTASAFLGKPYDPLFGWKDDRIYSSELVWKTYHRAWGIDLGQIQAIGQLDLTNPSARTLKKARLAAGELPTDTLTTPEAIRKSPRLDVVVKSP